MDDQVGNMDMNPSISRRGFLKSCSVAAAALGLSEAMIPKLVEAAESAPRPPVLVEWSSKSRQFFHATFFCSCQCFVNSLRFLLPR